MTNEMLQRSLSPSILLDVQSVDMESVFRRLNTLNMVHHLTISSGDDLAGIIGKEKVHGFMEGLDRAIQTTMAFHFFLDENRIALDEVKSNINALVFGRISDVVSMYEEYITKEDPLRDTLLQLVPFLLSMFSEKSYISSAEIGQKGVLREHALGLYADIYSFLKETRSVTGEEAAEISLMMDQLHAALEQAVKDEHGLLLFTGLYLALYNLRVGEIINMVNHQPEKMKAEV